jgi:hypothetical protein
MVACFRRRRETENGSKSSPAKSNFFPVDVVIAAQSRFAYVAVHCASSVIHAYWRNSVWRNSVMHYSSLRHDIAAVVAQDGGIDPA